jgi:transposase-like protein
MCIVLLTPSNVIKWVLGAMAMKRSTSRRATPWEGKTELTPTQEFLKVNYDAHYIEHHVKVSESGEAAMINSYVPHSCPFCSGKAFKKSGHTKSGVQRYKCGCGKTFLPTTGTIFDEHRISISEWIEYCLNLFRHVSITADSWSNKNDFKTSRYWLEKLFLTLDGVQNSIVLAGKVWLDETFFTVRSDNMEHNASGEKLRGISRNQICIGVATDKHHTLLLTEGIGRPSQKLTLDTFGSHIQQGSTLIHDGEFAHRRLVKELDLKSVAYASKSLRGIPDNENPLYPVNRVHAILKMFLNEHSSFDRSSLQGYLNLFAFVSNPPLELLEKVELIIDLAFQNPRLLRYREFYAINPCIDE